MCSMLMLSHASRRPTPTPSPASSASTPITMAFQIRTTTARWSSTRRRSIAMVTVGNYCYPDFDNVGVVNAADLSIVRTMFFKPPVPWCRGDVLPCKITLQTATQLSRRYCCPAYASSRHVFGRDPVSFIRSKDAGCLPSQA